MEDQHTMEWIEARETLDADRKHLRNLTPQRDLLSGSQVRTIDALVAKFGEAMIRVRPEGVAGVFHIEHPQEIAWLVNPDGDVAEYMAVGHPTYVHSAQTVAAW
jgi:cytochrome oxidase Cu insertion factor (SCO1/SenC/PrrC family)